MAGQALPFSTKVMGTLPLDSVQLHDHLDPLDEGPRVQRRKNNCVSDGILRGWSTSHANSFTAPPKPFDLWDVSWGEEEDHWEANVVSDRVSCPEDVETLLPAKWMDTRLDSLESDNVLQRVCSMCTLLVQKYVALETNAPPKSASEWRLRETLGRRIGAITELLEAAIGESIPIVSLRDPSFMKQCWSRISEEEQSQLFATLNTDETE